MNKKYYYNLCYLIHKLVHIKTTFPSINNKLMEQFVERAEKMDRKNG